MTTRSTASSHTAPELAEVPARAVLAIDGAGAPEGEMFQAAVGRLDTLGGDAPIEGAYWSDDDPRTFHLDRPDGWRWTLAVPAPADVAPSDPATGVRLEHRPIQRVARLVHHGPYADEGPSLAALYAFVAAHRLAPAGPHTEVYLTDPRRTPPADLRTELRVPVR